MGGCASTQARGSHGKKPGKRGKPLVVRVIHMDGRVKEFNLPICSAQILSQNPGCFLTCSDTMILDSFPAHVPEPEELNPAHLYFLMPKCQAQKPLSLEDLCELAVKASSNISIDDLQLSFRHYAI